MIDNCCAFTGHRPKKFPWGYDESDNNGVRCLILIEVSHHIGGHGGGIQFLPVDLFAQKRHLLETAVKLKKYSDLS